jgi:hypothetical protein
VPTAAPDPTAPQEWNLANLRKTRTDLDHFWTLQIAAYWGSPERKKYATDAVRDARAQGIEAYYYHGQAVSSVCIGCWPQSAVRETPTELQGTAPEERVLMTPARVTTGDSGQPNQGLPKDLMREYERKGVTVKQPELQIVDPTLLRIMQIYPQHFVNGVAEGVRGAGNKLVPKASFLVEVPARDASPLMGGGDPTVVQDPAAAPPPMDAIVPVSPTQPPVSGKGSGRLKSVGQK